MARADMTHVPYKGQRSGDRGSARRPGEGGFSGDRDRAAAPPSRPAARARRHEREAFAADAGRAEHQRGRRAGYDATLWLGIAAPKGTPAAIIARLNKEIARAVGAADVRDAFVKSGTDALATTPDAFGALIKSEYSKWGRVIRDIGLTVNCPGARRAPRSADVPG